MIKILKVECNEEGIKKTSQIIKEGGIVVFPTDTVYGIGCNPYSENAVKKIYEIKSREKVKALPVLAYSIDIVKKIVVIDKFTENILQKNWPGPLTLILELKDQELKKCGLLVGTSANISGNPSSTDPRMSQKYYKL